MKTSIWKADLLFLVIFVYHLWEKVPFLLLSTKGLVTDNKTTQFIDQNCAVSCINSIYNSVNSLLLCNSSFHWIKIKYWLKCKNYAVSCRNNFSSNRIVFNQNFKSAKKTGELTFFNKLVKMQKLCSIM